MKDGQGIYFWADGAAYQGSWQNGKKHGTSFYVEKQNPSSSSKQLKIRKGIWENGKRKEWLTDITADEIEKI